METPEIKITSINNELLIENSLKKKTVIKCDDMIGLKRSARVGERKEYRYVVAGVHSINSQREKIM